MTYFRKMKVFSKQFPMFPIIERLFDDFFRKMRKYVETGTLFLRPLWLRKR